MSLSHTRADTHDCTLTFQQSNKVLFLQLASAKLSREERCLILVKTNPMRCRHPGVAHTCSTYVGLRALLLGISHCFHLSSAWTHPLFWLFEFREEVSIFRKSMWGTFVSPFPGGSICLQSNHTTWRMLTDARICAALKCTSTTEQMQTHRDKHTNTAGPNTNLSIKPCWRDV